MITVLAFLVTLGILVVIHEYGHYRMAVACGVKVLRFSVGFGKVLYSRRRGADNTEFVVSMLPLGGYVRMLDEREAPVDSSELHRAFNRKPLWQRAAIVAAGPLANLILAIALYAGANWIGIDEPKAVIGAPPASSLAAEAGLRSGDWVRAWSRDGNEWTDLSSMTELRWQVTQALLRGEPLYLNVTDSRGAREHSVMVGLDTLGAKDLDAESMRRIGLMTPYSEPLIGEVAPGGPAAKAGLRAGDLVLSVEGEPVQDAASLRDRIRADKEATALRFRVLRNGSELDIDVTPRLVGEGDAKVARVEAYIGKAPEMVTVRYGLLDGIGEAVTKTWEVSALTLKMMAKMVVGQVSVKNLSGPLTIADYAGQSVRLGLAYYLGFLALVSVSLGILNLLPLPMLDGGHLMYYLFEAVTGRPVSDIWLERLQRGGVVIMLMMMSLALYNDMARILGFQ